jgi:hypothetical protein
VVDRPRGHRGYAARVDLDRMGYRLLVRSCAHIGTGQSVCDVVLGRIEIEASKKLLPRQGEVARLEGVTEGEVRDVVGCVSSPSVMPSACHLPLAGEEFG